MYLTVMLVNLMSWSKLHGSTDFLTQYLHNGPLGFVLLYVVLMSIARYMVTWYCKLVLRVASPIDQLNERLALKARTSYIYIVEWSPLEL